MMEMFSYCQKVNLDINSFDTSRVTNMMNMFENCDSLTSIDISGFDISSLTNMAGMFGDCDKLTKVVFPKSNKNNVINIQWMFANCIKLANVDFSGFDTSSVLYMDNMFSGCTILKNVNFNGVITSKVKAMQKMFYNCSTLSSLDLCGFDTSKVTAMNEMFSGCSRLTTIYASEKWNVNAVVSSEKMFYGCTRLPNFSSSYVDKTRANTGEGGYLTYKEYSGETLYKHGILDVYPANGYKYADIYHPTIALKLEKPFIEQFKGLDLSSLEGSITIYNYENDELVYSIDISSCFALKNNNDMQHGYIFCENNEVVLQPNTKYYITVSSIIGLPFADGSSDFEGFSNKDVWSFTTAPVDYPITTNPKGNAIDIEYYNLFFKPLTALWERILDDGKKGTCFGYAYSVAANYLGYTGIQQILANTNQMTMINNDNQDSIYGTNDWNFSYYEYVKLAHVFQLTSTVQNEVKASLGKISDLINIIKGFENNNNTPVILGVQLTEGNHEIMPLGIISESNEKRSFVPKCGSK